MKQQMYIFFMSVGFMAILCIPIGLLFGQQTAIMAFCGGVLGALVGSIMLYRRQ